MSKSVEPIAQTTITLSRPLVLDDKTIETLKIREPEVRDFRIANQQGNNAVDREVIVAARCCGLVLEDMDGIAWKDYQKIQKFLFGENDSEGNAE
ncbi:hypothetical protein A1D23_07495 [Chelonobacter oris]|uniref:phage tail assembly protein n=1 Tax=Chelonobacter oris TaxID=505317 RepID=UPI00244BBF17|nr:phage tail assembly protein [Chelonobacter oris]MDH2999932.1 hypothetical protein [Chelonobacter oris]